MSEGHMLDDAISIWLSGGWAMIAIAVIALVMFSVGMHIQLRMRAEGFLRVPERTWRRWIDHPSERRGPIGELLNLGLGMRTLKDTAHFFDELETSRTVPFRRDLRVMKACVAAAPLVGLLGTVTGMLATFGALASGSGGEKTMGMIASGISEALITTETGLVIALPGLFFQYQLTRNYERYRAFLVHFESVCTQRFHRREVADRRAAVERAARAEVARRLKRRLAQSQHSPAPGASHAAPQANAAAARDLRAASSPAH